MSKLIALVAVACMVNGVRTTVNPGEEVPDLHPLDAEELKRMGSVQDLEEQAADEKAAAKAQAKAKKEFADARKLEQAKAAAADLTLQT